MQQSHTALIIDPSSTSRKTLTSLIRQYFKMKEIYSAASTSEAAGILRQSENIDWVFCCNTLADKDSFKFLEELKKTENTANAKFVLLSADGGKEALIKAATHGVNDIILKPFSPKIIFEKVKKLATGQNQRKSRRIPLLEAYEAHIEFKSAKYKSALIDISLGGCMAKAPLFKEGGMIYEKAIIHIPLEEKPIKFGAELVRLERDNTTESKIILAAFIFREMSPKSEKVLSDFVSKFKITNQQK